MDGLDKYPDSHPNINKTMNLCEGHVALYPAKVQLLSWVNWEMMMVVDEITILSYHINEKIVDLVSDERIEHVCEVGFNAGKRWDDKRW